MAAIDKYFQQLVDTGASDLHLSQGQPPKIRIHGELLAIEGHPVLDEPGLREYMYEIVTARQRDRYEATGDLDFAYGLEGVARFRCNFLKQVHGRGAVFIWA